MRCLVSLAALCMLAVLQGCGGPGAGISSVASTGPGSTLTILPLGDSNTVGSSGTASAPDPANYRADLDAALRVQGYTVSYIGQLKDERQPGYTNVLHEGLAGWTLAELLNGKVGYHPLNVVEAYKPHFVLLMAGTNDLLTGATAADTMATMARMLDAIRTRAPDSVVLVATLFPMAWHFTRPPGLKNVTTAVNPAVLAFNDLLRAEVRRRAGRERIVLADMYVPGDPSTLGVDDLTDNGVETDLTPALHGGVAVHATPTGYAKAAAIWARAVTLYLGGHTVGS